MSPRPLLLALLLGLAGSIGSARAQEVWQADVRIQTMDVTRINGNVIARVVVYSDNDDEARAVHIEILLPVGVGVVRTAAGCVASASPTGVSALRARVMCDLGNLPVGSSREVYVMTTAPAPASQPQAPRSFAAFALSDTPDPKPGNNYAERSLP